MCQTALDRVDRFGRDDDGSCTRGGWFFVVLPSCLYGGRVRDIESSRADHLHLDQWSAGYALEGRASVDHLVQNAPQGPHIA